MTYNRQYNGQMKKTKDKQWPITDNTTVKWKRQRTTITHNRQYSGFDHCIVCYGSMFVLCLFHLTIVLSVMGQCLSFVFFIWPLYCLLWVIVVRCLFHLTVVLSVMGHCLSGQTLTHNRQYNGQMKKTKDNNDL
jgi:hypothetical protein